MRNLRNNVLLPLAIISWGICTPGSDFEFSITSALDGNAEKFVVQKSNIRTFYETFKPHCRYWAAAANDIPAQITFRFPLEMPMSSARLNTNLLSSNFENNVEFGSGKGEGSLWCSKDGKDWILLLEAKPPKGFAAKETSFNGQLPVEMKGAREIWIHVRMLASGMKDGTYSTAQFARTDPYDKHFTPFFLRVTYDRKPKNEP